VFLDIEKAFDIIWHSGLLYKLSDFSTSLIKLIASFLTERERKKLSLGRSEFLRQDKKRQGFLNVPSLLQYCTVYSDIWMMHPRHLELILFCSLTIPIFARQRNTNVVFSVNCNADSLQWIRGVSAETWRSMKGDFRRSISPEDLRFPGNIPKLNGRDTPFINNVTYLGVTFERRVTRRQYWK
jgi:hypothetical protein